MSVKRTPSRTQSRIPTPVSTTASAFQSIRRNRIVRMYALWRPENISSTPHGLNQRLIESAINFTTQAVDVYLDDVGHPFPVRLPKMLTEHLAGDDLAGITHQELQQTELGGGQAQLRGAARDMAISEVQRQRPDLEQRRWPVP